MSALDRFVPKGQAQSIVFPTPKFGADNQLTPHKETDYYKLSNEKMKEFQDTLKRFSVTLKSRKIFKKLGVEIREPGDYNLDYVLSIAKLIEERREGADNTRDCKRFIRKCFRGAAKHKDVLTGIISMAPSDIYGSVISGGFTLILAVSLTRFHFGIIVLTFVSLGRRWRSTRIFAKTSRQPLLIYRENSTMCTDCPMFTSSHWRSIPVQIRSSSQFS